MAQSSQLCVDLATSHSSQISLGIFSGFAGLWPSSQAVVEIIVRAAAASVDLFAIGQFDLASIGLIGFGMREEEVGDSHQS